VRGSKIEFNVVVATGGYLQVELRDQNGVPIPGYTLAEAEQLVGDQLFLVATRKTKKDIASLQGRNVKVHVRWCRAKLFAFQWR
jgi:hypothetical protein